MPWFKAYINNIKIQDNSHLRLVITVVAVLIVSRVAAFSFTPETFSFKSYYHDDYWRIAVNLFEGKGYTIIPGFPTTLRGPVNSIIWYAAIYLFGKEPSMIITLTLWSFEIGTVILIYIITHYLSKDKFACLIASLLFAFSIPNALLTLGTFSEPIFTLLLLVTFYIFLRLLDDERYVSCLLLGISIGLTTLTRSTGILLLVTYLFILAISKFKKKEILLKQTMLIIIAFIITTSPWILRNLLVFKHPIIGSAHTGWAMLQTYNELDKKDFWKYTKAKDIRKILIARLSNSQEAKKFDHTNFHGFLISKKIDEYHLGKICKDIAIEKIAKHPAKAAALIAIRHITFWTNIMLGTFLINKKALIVAIPNLFFLLILGLYFFKNKKVINIITVITIISVFTVAHAFVIAHWRLSTPLLPLLFIITGMWTSQKTKIIIRNLTKE